MNIKAININKISVRQLWTDVLSYIFLLKTLFNTFLLQTIFFIYSNPPDLTGILYYFTRWLISPALLLEKSDTEAPPLTPPLNLMYKNVQIVK